MTSGENAGIFHFTVLNGVKLFFWRDGYSGSDLLADRWAIWADVVYCGDVIWYKCPRDNKISRILADMRFDKRSRLVTIRGSLESATFSWLGNLFCVL